MATTGTVPHVCAGLAADWQRRSTAAAWLKRQALRGDISHSRGHDMTTQQKPRARNPVDTEPVQDPPAPRRISIDSQGRVRIVYPADDSTEHEVTLPATLLIMGDSGKIGLRSKGEINVQGSTLHLPG